jgi:L-malate glycosyltransferase
LHILFVAHDSEVHGGANRSLLTIIKNFKKEKDIIITVLLPRSEGTMNSLLTEIGVPWVAYKYNQIVTKKMKNPSCLLRQSKMLYKFLVDINKSVLLTKILREKNIDIIYTNTRVIFMGAFVARQLNIPHIWHVREFIEENNLRTVPYSFSLMNKLSNKIIVISRALRKTFDNKVDKEKLEIVYNGLPPIDNKSSILKSDKSFNILISGTIIPAKGQKDAIGALKILIDQGYENILLHLAGSDPERNKSQSYKKEISDFIREYNIKNHVIFHGEVENMNELRKIMNVELMCSSSEAFGRVTIEGMQSGLVVIGANTGATPEIIEDGINGLLYQSQNPKDLAHKIEMVIKDKNFEHMLSKNAIEFSSNNFTEKQNFKEIKNLVHKVYSEYSYKTKVF